MGATLVDYDPFKEAVGTPVDYNPFATNTQKANATKEQEPTPEELEAASRPSLGYRNIAKRGTPPVVVPAAEPIVVPAAKTVATPYKNRVEALDDAVNFLEENQDFNSVAKAFAKMGITPEQIAAHGKARNSSYFAQQTIPEPNVRGPYLGPTELASSDIKPEDQSIGRQIADIPLNLAQGAVSGIRMIAEAIPANQAGTVVSDNLRASEKYLGRLMSAQAQQDSEEISRIMSEAEGEGVAGQVRAGLKALSVAPVKTLTNALGTSAPVILAGLTAAVLGAPAALATGVGLAVGAVTGAGTIKGTIYDETKAALINSGVNKDDAEERAKLAQQYNGKNLDQILLGAAIGAGANITGIQPALAKTLAAKILNKAAAAETAKVATSETIQKAATEITKRSYGKIAQELTKAGLVEGTPEFIQAFQEKVAGNIAQQKEGFDVETYSGAVAAGTLEGLAGSVLGGGVKGLQVRSEIADANLTPSERFAKEFSRNVSSANFSPEGQEQIALDRLRTTNAISPELTRIPPAEPTADQLPEARTPDAQVPAVPPDAQEPVQPTAQESAVQPNVDQPTAEPAPIAPTQEPTDLVQADEFEKASVTPVTLPKVASAGLNQPFVNANRVMAITEVNGVKVPFYISTGTGGKASVPAGKWYPFLGWPERGGRIRGQKSR